MTEVKYLFSHWGSEHLSTMEFFNLVVSNNFNGIEINLPKEDLFLSNFLKALLGKRLENHEFILGLQQVFGVVNESADTYLDKVLKRLESFVRFRPNFINSHTGKDHYSFSDNCKIIEAIEEFSIKHKIPIYHEIHKGRFTFYSLGTLKYLEVFPNLKFVGDLSHWCVVSESMLQDQEETINKIIPKIHHIHARIGFEQSPQVNNPFVPEWNRHFNQYVKWWQDIINYHSRYRTMTITPEFGPFPYMPKQSFTQEPRSDQKLINIEMRNHLKSVLK